MSNQTSKMYIGYVVEIIKDVNLSPTLELKVRIPTLHGVDSLTGIKDENLPIAKPLLIPGTYVDKAKFLDSFNTTNKVLVILESGDLTKPYYLSLGQSSDTVNAL